MRSTMSLTICIVMRAGDKMMIMPAALTSGFCAFINSLKTLVLGRLWGFQGWLSLIVTWNGLKFAGRPLNVQIGLAYIAIGKRRPAKNATVLGPRITQISANGRDSSLSHARTGSAQFAGNTTTLPIAPASFTETLIHSLSLFPFSLPLSPSPLSSGAWPSSPYKT